MSKRGAGIWAGKLEGLGFTAYRCEQEPGIWSVWCQEAAEHFWEADDCRVFLRSWGCA